LRMLLNCSVIRPGSRMAEAKSGRANGGAHMRFEAGLWAAPKMGAVQGAKFTEADTGLLGNIAFAARRERFLDAIWGGKWINALFIVTLPLLINTVSRTWVMCTRRIARGVQSRPLAVRAATGTSRARDSSASRLLSERKRTRCKRCLYAPGLNVKSMGRFVWSAERKRS